MMKCIYDRDRDAENVFVEESRNIISEKMINIM